jgi:hypothetical protein
MQINVNRSGATRWVRAMTGTFMCLVTVSFDTARAQSSPAAGPKPKTLACAALLTAEELTAAVGEKMTEMGPRERGAGETECPWMLRGGSGFKTVAGSVLRRQPHQKLADRIDAGRLL